MALAGVLGRTWTPDPSGSGCSLSWLWTEELNTKGSRARQVVAGQQRAVSGQEGWSQQEKLAKSPRFYDVIGYVRILSSENCVLR